MLGSHLNINLKREKKIFKLKIKSLFKFCNKILILFFLNMLFKKYYFLVKNPIKSKIYEKLFFMKLKFYF